MEITEVRVRLVSNRDDRLKAFCTMTIDNAFAVRDIRVIEGGGGYFVAMPSRKTTDHCEKCGGKNHLRAKFCNNCGVALPQNRATKDPKGRKKLHADIAHPINTKCRQKIQDAVIAAFKQELEKAKQPGYEQAQIERPDEDVPEIV